MRRQRLFVATREDLRPGLEAIESEWALEYQLREMRDDPSFVVFRSLLDAPGLGSSRTGAMTTDDGYLVYPRGSTPRVRAVPQAAGGVKYEQELSSEVLILQPGGLHASGVLVAGRVGPCVAATADARGFALFQRFSKTVLREFHRIRSYWVGPEAYRALKAGKRLVTIGIGSPAAYDLADLD